MIQYKLLEVLDQDTSSKLIDIFDSSNVYHFTENIVGIKYNFSQNSYADVLRSIVGLNLRQWTMTSSRFIDIINYSINNNLSLGPVDFLEFIDSSQIEKINTNIARINIINDKPEKLKLKERLIKDLEWIMLDECIDIKSILISYRVDAPPFFIETRFFNNGVLYIDDYCVLNNLKKLFNNCFNMR